MAVERLGESDIGAGIEAVGQLDSLVIQVGVNGKAIIAATVRPERVLAGLCMNAEALVNFLFAAVGQVRNAARGRQPLARALGGSVIIAAVPERILLDGRDLRRLDANLPSRGAGRNGNDAGCVEEIGVHQCPLQRARATH